MLIIGIHHQHQLGQSDVFSADIFSVIALNIFKIVATLFNIAHFEGDRQFKSRLSKFILITARTLITATLTVKMRDNISKVEFHLVIQFCFYLMAGRFNCFCMFVKCTRALELRLKKDTMTYFCYFRLICLETVSQN